MSLPIIDGSSKALVGKLGVFVGMDYVGRIEFAINKTIPAGKIPAFGTTYSRATYNQLWEEVQKHPDRLLTEEAWQEFSKNNNGQVPYYSDGDGSTTFRVPCLTGFFEGAGSLEEVGTVKEAGLPEIEGVSNSGYSDSRALTRATGAFDCSKDRNTEGLLLGYFATTSSTKTDTINTFKASRSNPIYGNADTVQPPSIVGMWVITAFVAVTGISSTALDDIVSGVTEAETRIGALEENTNDSNNIKIIYPNGGTAEQPAEVTINNRYVEENPFPGYYVSCIVEILLDGEWAEPFMSYVASDNGGRGVTAGLVGDNIIVQTGRNYLKMAGYDSGSLSMNGESVKNAPCRVIVYKLGKIGE